MQSNSKLREELERSAWNWVDDIQDPEQDHISDENLSSAYRLFFPVHLSPEWKCKKNCRSNPKCFCALGETPWLEISKNNEANPEENEEEDDMSLERRLSGMPVGLKNLGNTCYVNSFLQIWFHNVPFREALYKWDPESDPLEAQNETLLEAENYRPCGKVASLQALFAMMEFTNRRAVDPNDFIAKLGLDPQVQQDAAEFSKLFISLLESSLSNQSNVEVGSIVQNQFRGEYAYVTRCCKCKRESKTPSFFYELDLPLQGQRTLLNCLEDFLKEEKLEGDNQYYCNGCESKQDAARCVRLSQLPPVLNLQLNRFIFDMQTGRKKKLNSVVQFPEILDMSHFLREEPSPSNTYHLTGVLMHVGNEANHGHYIAHIQESSTGQWFKFSDAHVEKLQGRNSTKLGSEIDPLHEMNGSPSNNGVKKMVNGSKNGIGKGMQGSNNAYMLVYTSALALKSVRNCENGENTTPSRKTKRKAEQKFDEGPLPMYLKAFIEQDRMCLENELKEQLILKETKHKEEVSLKSKMKDLYERVPPTDNSKFEFLPMEWLVRYFTNPNSPPPIDISTSTCVHGHLDLNKIQDVKAVNIQVAEELYNEVMKKEAIGKRLNQNSLCQHCVRNRCRLMKLARSLSKDHKEITDLLKQTVKADEEKVFWVGKNTLKKWRALARDDLERRIKEEDSQFLEEKVNGSSRGVEEVFNGDIICSHGNLCIQEAKRRLVPEEIWKKFQGYFRDLREFKRDAKVCQSCIANDDKAKEVTEKRKEEAASQKNALLDIFNERNRPSWSRSNLNKVYLVPRSFVSEWKNFIRSPQLNEAVKLIPNEILLCEHGGLIYPVKLDTESDYESVVYMVSEEEWAIMKNLFTVAQEISVTRNKTDDSQNLLSSEPPVCDECTDKRCRDEEDELLVYKNGTVYVRRLTGAERPPLEKDPSDPDFDCMNGSPGAIGPKRFKMNNGHCYATNGQYNEFVRRSNRRQKVRGEREFTVSSDTLLRDLKVKIMEVFKVAPFDQNLCLNGQYLTESGMTLGQLRVYPKSLIYLRADEPNPSISAVEPDDGWVMQHPEEGFKGTGLLEGS